MQTGKSENETYKKSKASYDCRPYSHAQLINPAVRIQSKNIYNKRNSFAITKPNIYVSRLSVQNNKVKNLNNLNLKFDLRRPSLRLEELRSSGF